MLLRREDCHENIQLVALAVHDLNCLKRFCYGHTLDLDTHLGFQAFPGYNTIDKMQSIGGSQQVHRTKTRLVKGILGISGWCNAKVQRLEDFIKK